MRSRLIHTSVLVAAVAAFFGTAPRASADTITATLNGTTGAAAVNYTLATSAGGTGTSQGATPGPYYWTTTASTLPGGAGPGTTFCIDLTHHVAVGSSYTFTVNPLSAATTVKNDGTTALSSTEINAKVNAITALFGNYYKTAWENPSTANTQPSYSAFQLALWELLYDSKTDLANSSNVFSGGNLTSTDTNANAAQNMLTYTLSTTGMNAGLAAFNTGAFANKQLVALTCSGAQDQIWLENKPSITTVPAPPAILLAGFGLMALAGRGRWNRQTPNPA